MSTIWTRRPASMMSRRVRGVRDAVLGMALVVGIWLWLIVRNGAALHLASLALGLTVAVVALRVIAPPTPIDPATTTAPRQMTPTRTSAATVRDTDVVVPPRRAQVRPTYYMAGSDEQAAEIARALHDAMRDARDAGRALDEPYRNARVVIVASAADEDAFRRAIDEADQQRQISGLPGMRVVDLRWSATDLALPAAGESNLAGTVPATAIVCGADALRHQC